MEPSIAIGAELFDITWWIVYDSVRVSLDKQHYEPNTENKWEYAKCSLRNQASAVGNAQNNAALDLIDDPNSWLYFLSDDNTMHEIFYEHLAQAIANYPGKRAFVFSQQVGAWVRGAGPGSMMVGAIDLGQYCVLRSLVGERRLDAPNYNADGILITTLYQEQSEAFEFLPFVMCNYNKLR
jgi:hypothetical protein